VGRGSLAYVVTPTERVAARVLVIDPDGCVLLLRGFDPGRPELGSYWFTPGGGLDEGETFEDAARRELREETGLVIDDVGPRIFEQRIEFRFEESHFSQTEWFFCVRTERFTIDAAEWTDIEMRSVIEHRWWSAAELIAADDRVYPDDLAERLARIAAG